MQTIRLTSPTSQCVFGYEREIPPFVDADVPDHIALALIYGSGRARLAGHVQPVDDDGKLRVHFVAPFSTVDGYGSTAIDILPSLRDLLALEVTPLYGANPRVVPQDILRVISTPIRSLPGIGLLLGLPTSLDVLRERVRVVMTMWETDSYEHVFPAWTRQINSASGMIVPSVFCRDVFRGAGVVVPIDVVSLPAGRWAYTRRLHEPDGGRFRVITWANMGPRKNAHGVIKAFLQAFGGRDDVELIIKSTARSRRYTQFHEYRQDDRIKWIFDDWSPDQMLDFVLGAHVVLYMSHGEGSGRPPREAMALGVPLICANNSGMMEIVNENIWSVESAKHERSPLGGQWAMPDVDQATTHLRSIYDDYESACVKATTARVWFRKQFNAKETARGIATALTGYVDEVNAPQPFKHVVPVDERLGLHVARELGRFGLHAVRFIKPDDLDCRWLQQALCGRDITITDDADVLFDFHRLEHGSIEEAREYVSDAIANSYRAVVIVVPSQFYKHQVIGDEQFNQIRFWRARLPDGATYSVRATYVGTDRSYIMIIASGV